tara:strand:- start:107 stop:1006 length:900 start_codon:yes stop_codon:yes gene_type:complete
MDKLKVKKYLIENRILKDNISVEEMESFANGRGEGAEKIADNAKEKGGNSMLTYHHFKVKAPYYKKAIDGKFDKNKFTEDYEGFLEELYEKTKDGMNITPVAFQEIMGKIEVLGELLVENKEPLNEQEEKDNNKVAEAALILPRGKKVVLQAEEKDYKRGLIVELTEEGGYKINYWYGEDVKIYPAEVEVDGESIKDDANEVYIKFHPELKEEKRTLNKLISESLRDWFTKEDWVRIDSAGNIAGPCGTSKNKKNPDRCLPRKKAQSLTQAQRKATAAKKKKAGSKGKQVVPNTKKAKL